MATREDLSEQLAVTQKLAAAVDAMARSMARVESSYESQIDTVHRLTTAVENLKSQDLSGLNNTKLNDLRKEVKDSEGAVKSLSDRLKDLGDRMRSRFPKAMFVAEAAITGLYKGFTNVMALSKGVFGFFSGLADKVFSLAATIIAFPFKTLSRLIDLAAGAGAGVYELALKIEEVRKQFGDLAGPGAGAVLHTAKTLKGFSDTGLSAFRVFGLMHERIETILKVATAMGATFSVLTAEFDDAGGAILGFQKGLGIADENMKAVAARAITMGKPFTKVMLDMTKQTLALGEAFDIDQKLIGRDMAKAMQNVKHFGALANKEIAQAAVYSRKLGVELEKIVGTLDAFETFDQAAENAAKLSQTFGVQIDAFQMMEAQNPADQIEMLRKQLKAAGVDASQFTRQQAKLLATTTGLDEATARQVFSLQNQGVSLDEIKKKSEAAEKKQMTQAEAMSKLADSIERLIKSGAGQKGGFWDMFVEGISRGIQSSQEFRSIIWNIKKGLWTVMLEGVQLGKALVNVFPGMKEFLGGIADFFQPAKFKALTGGVVDIIIDFFSKLRTGQWSFEQLMKDLKEKFFNFFDRQMPAGKKMLEGFKDTFKTITKIVAEGIKWAVDRVGEGIRFITEIIRDPSKLAAKAKEGAGQFGFLGEVLLLFVDVLKHAWKVIAPALWELVKTVGKKLWGYLKSDEFIGLIKPAMPWVAMVLFGPAFAKAILAALAAYVAPAIVGFFTGGTGKKAIEQAATAAANKVMEASKKVADKAPDAKGVSAVGAAATESGKAVKAADGWGVQDAVKLGLKLIAIATALSVGGVLMATAIVGMKLILKKGGIESPEQAAAPLLVLGAMVVSAVPLMLALRIASAVVEPAQILKGGLAVGFAVGIVGAIGAGLALLMTKIASPEQLDIASKVMLKMSLVFLSMVPLLVAAGALGVIIASTGGLALAAAAIGMTAIAGGVATMALAAVAIIKALGQLNVDEGLQAKVDVFLGVMKAIQAFTDTIVKIIGMMKPSFIEIFNRGDKFQKRVNASIDLITTLIGAKGSGQGIVGLAETALDLVKGMPAGEEIAQKASIFGSVVQAMTSMLEAFKPPDEFLKATTDIFGLPTGALDGSMISQVQDYIFEMGSAMVRMADKAVSIVKQLVRVPIPDVSEAELITKLLSSLASVMKEMTPSPQLAQTFLDVKETKWRPFGKKVQKFDAAGAAKFFESARDQMEKLLPVIKDTLTGLADKMASYDEKKLESLKVVGPIMASVSEVISSIVKSGKGKEVNPVEINETVQWAVKEAPNYEEMFDSLGTVIPKLLESVIKAVDGIKVGPNFAAIVKTAEQLFGFLKTITDVASTLAGAGSGQMIDPTAMVHAMQKLAWFMWAIVEGGGGYGRGAHGDAGSSPLRLIVSDFKKMSELGLSDTKGKAVQTATALAGLFESLKKIADTVTNMPEISDSVQATAITNLNQFADFVAQLSGSGYVDAGETGGVLKRINDAVSGEAMKQVLETSKLVRQYADSFKGITGAIKTGAIVPALESVAEMVKQTQALDDDLSKLPKLNVVANLEKVAKAAGLGGKAVYQVKSKELVINMNVQINMNVDEVERVMIMRPTSHIRDRINFALNNPDDKASSSLIPDQYTTGFTPAAKSGE